MSRDFFRVVNETIAAAERPDYFGDPDRFIWDLMIARDRLRIFLGDLHVEVLRRLVAFMYSGRGDDDFMSLLAAFGRMSKDDAISTLSSKRDLSEYLMIGLAHYPYDHAERYREMEYRDYLQTDYWKDRRQAALQIGNSRCRSCGHGRRLQVHHLTYERLGEEWHQDLHVLCRDCHREEHGLQEEPI